MAIRTLVLCVVSAVGIFFGQIVLSAGSDTAKEIVLQLVAPNQPQGLIKPLADRPLPAYHATVRKSRSVAGSPPRQRNPELSVEQLVIVGVDSAGREITRTNILDPRIIRSERVDPKGRVSSELIYKAQAEFHVFLADDPAITGLKVFQPRWTGTEFVLDLIAEVGLP